MDKIVIVGAGLAGTLLGIRLAQRNHEVYIFERRPDLRKVTQDAGRSINLALSDRGLKALRMIGLEEKVREYVIPMYGRMIHRSGREPELFRYSGRKQDWINSVSRPGLNALLLEKAESYPNISINFNCSCLEADPESGKVRFYDRIAEEEFDMEASVIFGADGAGSAVRQSIFKYSNKYRFNFSQQFLSAGYKELEIPAGSNKTHRIEKNALHIWPRGKFMLIALPNLDGSFTVTLFLPFEGAQSFSKLDSDAAIQSFFSTNFPDAFAHMPNLIQDFHDNPTSALGTIKCYPWQVNSTILLIGDAAHAIVPFYGQGMNCAFEDSVIMDKYLDQYGNDWRRVLDGYQSERRQDTDAIADLAVDNFYEMGAHTADPVFNRKRKIELTLEQIFPEYYSKYSLVTFREDLPYHEAMQLGRKQDAVLMDIARSIKDVEAIDYQNVLEQVRRSTS